MRYAARGVNCHCESHFRRPILVTYFDTHPMRMTASSEKRLLLPMAVAALGCLGFAAPQGHSIDRVRWLTGCWEAVNAHRTIHEQWTAPQGRVMLGTARTLRRDSLTEFEFVVLREKGSRLSYEAHPSGQRGATFLSVALGDSAVTFENLQHDFPQRVGYTRRGADSVVTWISGPSGATTRRIEFPYRRRSCEPAQ